MRLGSLFDWLDSRTGFRAGVRHLLDEPLPSGVGWWFVTGSVLLFLLAVQLATGIVLTMYYVPAPEYAYDSVRFITEQLTFGRTLRGLHFFGASFIVIAAVIHMMRVVLLGSYKKPREVTWITGVVLLLLILGFALTGYLLPWDQRAYWATTVTINVARRAPFGEQVAGLLRGGTELGALTLLRWYTMHVFLLPACLIGFVVAHLYLMRRHGISGPIVSAAGATKPFYPYHALKDTIVIAAAFALLITFVVLVPAPLADVADPTDAKYVPRPEWYFLSLFQLLKYFPGPLEPIATLVIPGAIVGLLFVLPFLDRRGDRHPMKRPLVTGFFVAVGVIVAALTYLGLVDTPANADPTRWSPLAIAGREFARDDRCTTCHREGGPASPVESTRLRKDPEWLLAHVRDPEVITPGSRELPEGGMSASQARSILSYMRKLRVGSAPPSNVGERERLAYFVLGRYCATCHMIEGEGGSAAPDLSTIGRKHDAKFLRAWITEPEAVDPAANMPPFGGTLSNEQMSAIVNYLAARK